MIFGKKKRGGGGGAHRINLERRAIFLTFHEKVSIIGHYIFDLLDLKKNSNKNIFEVLWLIIRLAKDYGKRQVYNIMNNKLKCCEF